MPPGVAPASGAPPACVMRPQLWEFVIGSFQSLRSVRGRISNISLSVFGYRPYRFRKVRIPSAYWIPRKMSSASLSRWASADAIGRTAAMRIAITVIPTMSATSV